MTTGKKSSARDETARFEDELIQSILDASTDELHELLDAMGLNSEQVGADVDASIQRAIRHCGQERLRRAKMQFSAWSTRHDGPLFGSAPLRQEVIGQVRAAARSLPITLAARNGKELSASDEHGLDDDLAEAQRLEREAEEE